MSGPASEAGESLSIRSETAADHEAIRTVNRLAFEQDGEGALVDALRAGGFATLSLVAEINSEIIGHILFSKMHIVSGDEQIEALALAPMAVAPQHQRQGIGLQLVRAALEQCRKAGHRLVLVVGHPDYYPRFGFSAALAEAMESPYAGEAFMALELVPGALKDVRGEVRYAPPFEGL